MDAPSVWPLEYADSKKTPTETLVDRDWRPVVLEDKILVTDQFHNPATEEV